MVDLNASVNDIGINAVTGAVVIDIGVSQSKLVFRLDGFTVTDPLQAPRRVGPNLTEKVSPGRSRQGNRDASLFSRRPSCRILGNG